MQIFIGTMVKTLITECLWVLLAALIAVYFISERITSPLKKMSMAAKSFAAGQAPLGQGTKMREDAHGQ